VCVGQARRPPAPIERASTEAISQSRERCLAPPGIAPHILARTRILVVGLDHDCTGGIETHAREVLHMLGYTQTAGIEQQHAHIGVAINFLRAIPPEHSPADDHRVESYAAVLGGCVPGITDDA